MKKSYLIMAAIASLALASCSNEEFVGENDPGTGQGNPTVIRFGSLGKGLTRADLTGEAAAEKLKNNFVFEGTKAVGNTTYSLVINDYQANYANNTAHQTESNSNNWEYVGYKNVPGGVTANTGVPTFAATTDNTNAITQSIKYWDYGTTQYDFAAYSLGIGATANNATTYATASAIDFANLGKPVMTTGENPTMNTPVYSLTGSAEDLKACYISDLVTAYNQSNVSDYGNVVTFSFRSLAAKIRMAFYETVPGYSVKDIQFYSVAKDNNNQVSGEPTSTPTLFTSTAVLPSGSGTMNIFFPTVGWSESGNETNSTKNTDYNKAHVKFTQASGSNAASTLIFGTLNDYANAESKESSSTTPATGWIGRSSNTATYAGGLDNGTGKYYTILPYEDGANLLLRIKYTLVSIDGSGEEITVDNATAVIPAELAKWNPNYAYTYIFKISDMTNGTTGVDASTNKPIMGLTPITLNAVVVDSEDGIQETITTVSEPSITTYTQGQVVTANDEYIADKKIYVIVNNGTSNVTLTTTGNDADAINAKLYTVEVQDDALQTITEESVDNAIRFGTHTGNTYTVKDAADKTLIVTEASGLTASTTIAAEDSPTGNEITVTGAYFTAGAAGTIYAFQYRKVDADKTTYTAVEANTYNEKIPGAISITSPATKTGYKFKSYGSADNSQPYGNGKAKVISVANGWTTVLVTSNSIAGFAGKQYKVQATTPVDNTYYQLYETNGTPTGIYVTVTSEDYTDTEVYNYNITLPGAVKEGTIKPDAYGYKIIKIKK